MGKKKILPPIRPYSGGQLSFPSTSLTSQEVLLWCPQHLNRLFHPFYVTILFFKFSNQFLLAWNFMSMKLIFSIFFSKSTSVTTWIFCKLSCHSMLLSWTSLHILRGRWTEDVLETTHGCSHVAFSAGGGGMAVASLVWGARTELFPDQMIWES